MKTIAELYEQANKIGQQVAALINQAAINGHEIVFRPTELPSGDVSVSIFFGFSRTISGPTAERDRQAEIRQDMAESRIVHLESRLATLKAGRCPECDARLTCHLDEFDSYYLHCTSPNCTFGITEAEPDE